MGASLADLVIVGAEAAHQLGRLNPEEFEKLTKLAEAFKEANVEINDVYKFYTGRNVA